MDTLGKRLSMARTNAKLTQSEVAEKLGVTSQSVSLWERDETSPDTGKILELANLYSVTCDWILGGNVPDQDILDVSCRLSDRLFDEKRMYTYVKAYVTAKKLYQAARVLPYARDKHEGQVRKGEDKVPYIYHPLLLTCHALSLGLDEDNLLSACLLHDVCEDCEVLVDELPTNDVTKEAVALLTKDKEVTRASEEGLASYYNKISENRIASIVKILDRCNNISSMTTSFTDKRMAQYIQETEKYIYPLMDKTANEYPEHSNQIFLIKYHMTSVVEAIRHGLARRI